MKFSGTKRRLFGLVLLLGCWTGPAFAQGCAMCYTTVKGTPKDGQRAIGRAIVVLLAPPLGVMTVGVGWAFRYGRRRDRENNRDDSSV